MIELAQKKLAGISSKEWCKKYSAFFFFQIAIFSELFTLPVYGFVKGFCNPNS